MSVYPAPTRYPSIFNATLFSNYSTNYSTDTYLSSADANATYAKLAGGQTIQAQETFAGGILTDSIGPLVLGNNGVSISDDTYVNGTLYCSSVLAETYSSTTSVLQFTSDVNVLGNITVTGLATLPGTTFTGNITQNANLTTSLRTTTVDGTLTCTRLLATGTSTNEVTNTTTATSGLVTPLRVLASNTSSLGTTQIILGQSDATARCAYLQYVPNGFTSSATYVNLGIGGYNPVVTLRNGCLGINNITNPTYNLHVSGTGYVSGNLTCAGAMSFNSPLIQGTSWVTSTLSSSTYTTTISSTTLPVLSQTDFQGQLYIFAKNGSTNSGMLNFFLIKRNSGTISATATSTPPSNFTTLTLTTSASSLAISTGTTASQISCLFIGAY